MAARRGTEGARKIEIMSLADAEKRSVDYPEWTEYRKKNGLDPLGMQNSSVSLYQTLLPGISKCDPAASAITVFMCGSARPTRGISAIPTRKPGSALSAVLRPFTR